MSTSSNSSRGIGVGDALALLFIGLKLGHVIDWSWWWVLSPIWSVVCLLLFLRIIAGLVGALEK